MTFLPLQFSWSAASAYCQHEETSTAAHHFGHHLHVHQIDAKDKNSSSKNNKAFHLDCSFCHVSHFAVDIPRYSSAQPKTEAMLLNLYDSPLFYTSYISKGLDRPDWRFAS
jgi:hypothetical protein